MSDSQITLKHNKHRIYPCPKDKKISLLRLLFAQNSNLDTVVAANSDIELIKEALGDKSIKIFSDKELLKMPDFRCELLISYDLPAAIVYMARLAKATEGAIILLDIDEQKDLYPIETLLGRVIRQEVLEGFEYEYTKMKIAPKTPIKEKKSFDKPKRDCEKPKYDKPKRDGEKPKYDKSKKDGEKPKYDKAKKDDTKSSYKPFDKPKTDDKKGKKPNKFLGKDENGKAKFSGKSGERNHRYDGTPKVEAPKKEARKIPIKERKPKED